MYHLNRVSIGKSLTMTFKATVIPTISDIDVRSYHDNFSLGAYWCEAEFTFQVVVCFFRTRTRTYVFWRLICTFRTNGT